MSVPPTPDPARTYADEFVQLHVQLTKGGDILVEASGSGVSAGVLLTVTGSQRAGDHARLGCHHRHPPRARWCLMSESDFEA